MVKAVLFDLFETLATESRTRPVSVSSLAPDLGRKLSSAAHRAKARSCLPVSRDSAHAASSSSILTQGLHQIDSAGTKRREEAGRNRHHAKADRRDPQRNRIRRSDVQKQRLQHSTDENCQHRPE